MCMHYYFWNNVHRNVHVFKHSLIDNEDKEYQSGYVVAFQTNWSNKWYYLNDLRTLGDMEYATEARFFDTEKEAYTYMHNTFFDLRYQGIDKKGA